MKNINNERGLTILFQGLVDDTVQYHSRTKSVIEKEAIIKELREITEQDIPILLDFLTNHQNPNFRYYAALALKIYQPRDEKLLEKISEIYQIEEDEKTKELLYLLIEFGIKANSEKTAPIEKEKHWSDDLDE